MSGYELTIEALVKVMKPLKVQLILIFWNLEIFGINVADLFDIYGLTYCGNTLLKLGPKNHLTTVE